MACSNTVKLVSHPLHQKEHGVVHGGRLAPVHVPKLIPTTQSQLYIDHIQLTVISCLFLYIPYAVKIVIKSK